MIVGKNMFPVSASYSSIARMRQQFDILQIQLATGRKAQSLSEMGPSRSMDIDLRQRGARVDAYQQTISMVNTRLDVMDLVLARMDTIEGEARSFAANDAAGEHNLNIATAQDYAKSHLDEVINLLNSEIAGRHIFGGSDTDDAPVAGVDAILNGEDGKAGFRTIVSERKAADAGPDGMGRIGVSRAGAAIVIGEDGTHPFGYKLSGVSTDSAAVVTTAPAGAPPSMSVTFTGVPNAGEKVFATLTLPDGTTRTLALEATSGGSPEVGQFTIGADALSTAQNFENALKTAILDNAETELPAASVFAASENFFNGNGETIQRVDGPPFDTATSLVAASSADTITWYDGSSSASARQSVSARIGESATVGYGAEGNERGFLELVRSLAAVAVETFADTDSTAAGRYDALTDRQVTRLAESNNNAPGSIEVITMELGVVRNTMGNYSTRHDAYKGQIDSVLAELESAPVSEVAMKMNELDTRLQASYQAVSIISQLSLVNYMK